MSTTHLHWRSGALLDAGRTIFNQIVDDIRMVLAQQAAYRQTEFELSSLSNRALKDIGITRGDIKRLAMEAAHGCE